MQLLGIRGQRSSFLDFRDALESRESFRTSGSLRGEPDAFSTGYLPSLFADEYNARIEHIDYTVLSYATPIAWHDEEFGWIVPDIVYSTTTARHQSVIRAALGRGEFDTAPRI